MTTLKSIGAVLAGMIAGAVLSIATDYILEKTGVFPDPQYGLFVWWMLLIALVYRSIFTIVSGFITAWLAPNNPVRHAIILGAIGVGVTLVGSVVNWDKSAAWYPLVLIVITFPCTWMGGKAYIKHTRI
jgi:hypothetical protein